MFDYYWGDKKKKKKEKEPEQEDPNAGQIILLSPPDGGGGDSPVEVQDNKIYYYGAIDDREVLHLNKALNKLDIELQIFHVKYGTTPPPIQLHISSYGGSLFAGLAAVDAIGQCRTPVHTYVDGYAASAATLLSIVGKQRFISENSYMLIHQLSAGTWGKYEEIKDEMKNLDLLMDKMITLYGKHTRLPEEKLKEILKHDLWFSAEQCLEYGLVDKIQR